MPLHVLAPLVAKFTEYVCAHCDTNFSVLSQNEGAGMLCPRCMGPALVNGHYTVRGIQEVEAEYGGVKPL